MGQSAHRDMGLGFVLENGLSPSAVLPGVLSSSSTLFTPSPNTSSLVVGRQTISSCSTVLFVNRLGHQALPLSLCSFSILGLIIALCILRLLSVNLSPFSFGRLHVVFLSLSILLLVSFCLPVVLLLWVCGVVQRQQFLWCLLVYMPPMDGICPDFVGCILP